MIRCRFEDSDSDAFLRHVTADVVAVDDGKVVLVRRAEHLVEGGKLALPGGYMDRDETWAECAVREFREETGFDCLDLQLVNVDSRPGRAGNERQNVAAIFIARIGPKIGEPDAETTEMVWMDIDVAMTADLAFDHAQQVRHAAARVADPSAVPLLDGVSAT